MKDSSCGGFFVRLQGSPEKAEVMLLVSTLVFEQSNQVADLIRRSDIEEKGVGGMIRWKWSWTIDFCGPTLKVTLLRGFEERRPACSLLPVPSARTSVQQESYVS